MTDVLLISETKLRQFTDLNDNIDSKLINSGIRESQDIELQRILGTKLYKRLIDGIKAQNLTTDESTLLNDYVADALIYWAYYYCLEAIYMRPRNNGLLLADGGDNSSSVDTSLFDRKRQLTKNKAEWYSELLATYLIENESTFPQLLENTELYEKQADYSTQLRSPFVLRNNRGDDMSRLGMKVIDSRYPNYPQ